MDTKEYFQQESQELRKELNKAVELNKAYEEILFKVLHALIEPKVDGTGIYDATFIIPETRLNFSDFAGLSSTIAESIIKNHEIITVEKNGDDNNGES